MRISIVRLSCVVASYSFVTTSSSASEPSQEEVAACLNAHGTAQRLRRAADLKQAREELVSCARLQCPALVRADCTEWLTQVESAMPSIIVSARVGNQEVFDVVLSIDGKVVVKRLDGTPLEINPGAHTFKLEHPKLRAVEQRFLIGSYEKERLLTFDFEVPRPPPAQPERRPKSLPKPVKMHRPVPLATYLFAGGTALGAAGFITLAAIGKDQQRELQASECRPFCDDVGAVRTKYYIADASLILGGISGAFALGFYLTRPTVPVRAPTENRAKHAVRLRRVHVDAAQSGGVLRMGGEF